MAVEVETGIIAIKVDGKRRVLGVLQAEVFYKLQSGPLHWSGIHNCQSGAHHTINRLRKKLKGTPFYINTKPISRYEFIYELRRTDMRQPQTTENECVMNTSSPVANAETTISASETSVAVAPKRAQRANEYSTKETALVIDLWGKGHSSAYIVEQLRKQFGRTRTRNSVIGRVHRLNLPHRDTAMRHVSKSKVKRAPSKKVTPWKPKLTEPKPEPVILPPEPTPENLVPFTDAILSGTCTFSKLEWGKKCCGQKRHDNSSYCLRHIRESAR